jgi:purine-binding chemotaxis protein CheW
MLHEGNNTGNQYLVLNIGEHYFAANVSNIEDVIKRRKTTPVPLSKPNITGLLNLRGHIVTEIDVAMSLGIDRKLGPEDGMAVVITVDDEFYSLAFEGVGDVLTIEASEIDPLPETVQKSWHQVTRGVKQLDDKFLVLLDLVLLIDVLRNENEEAIAAQ